MILKISLRAKAGVPKTLMWNENFAYIALFPSEHAYVDWRFSDLHSSFRLCVLRDLPKPFSKFLNWNCKIHVPWGLSGMVYLNTTNEVCISRVDLGGGCRGVQIPPPPPEIKPSSYSLLTFGYLIGQWRHFLEVHPLFSWLQFPYDQAARVEEVAEDLVDMVVIEITGLLFIVI